MSGCGCVDCSEQIPGLGLGEPIALGAGVQRRANIRMPVNFAPSQQPPNTAISYQQVVSSARQVASLKNACPQEEPGTPYFDPTGSGMTRHVVRAFQLLWNAYTATGRGASVRTDGFYDTGTYWAMRSLVPSPPSPCDSSIYNKPGLFGVPSGLGDAASDLLAFNAKIVHGDALWTADKASGSYGDEIMAYQTAATDSIGTLSDEIKASASTAGQAQVDQATQSVNAQLHGITNTSTTDTVTGVTTGPTATDAQQAHDLAHQMLDLYTQAMGTSPTPVTLPPPPTPVPVATGGSGSGGSTGGSGSTSSSGGTTVTVAAPTTTRDLVIAAGIVAAGAGGWWLWKHKRRGRR
jgi:hypothetical protein